MPASDLGFDATVQREKVVENIPVGLSKPAIPRYSAAIFSAERRLWMAMPAAVRSNGPRTRWVQVASRLTPYPWRAAHIEKTEIGSPVL
jgi:hypothetical protein